MGGAYDPETMEMLAGARPRFVGFLAVAIVLSYGVLWLAGQSLGGPVEGARAILSMTSDAPFQADPQPSAPTSGSTEGSAGGHGRDPTGVIVGALALLLGAGAVLWRARRHRRVAAQAP